MLALLCWLLGIHSPSVCLISQADNELRVAGGKPQEPCSCNCRKCKAGQCDAMVEEPTRGRRGRPSWRYRAGGDRTTQRW